MTIPPRWTILFLVIWIVALAVQRGLGTAAYLNDALLPMVSGHQLLHGLWPHLHVETPVGLPYALANAAALLLSRGDPVAAAWAPALLGLLLLPAFWHALSSRLDPHLAGATLLVLLFFAAAPVSLEAIFPTYLAWYNHASLSLLSLLLLAWLRPPSGPTRSWLSEGLLLAVLSLLKPTAAFIALAGCTAGLLLRRLSPRHALQATASAGTLLIALLPSGLPQAQIHDLATALHATSLVPNAGVLSRLRLLLMAVGENLFILALVVGIALLIPECRARLAILAMAALLCTAATQNHGQWISPWLILAPLAGYTRPILPMPVAMATLGLAQQALLAIVPLDPPRTADRPQPWHQVPAARSGPMANLVGRLSLSPLDRDRATPARLHPLDDHHPPDLERPAGPLHALDEAWILARGEQLLRAHASAQDRVQTAGFTNPWPWALSLPPISTPLWVDAWRTVPLDRDPQTFFRNADLLMIPTSPRIRLHARHITPAIEASACQHGWRLVQQVPGWRLLAPPHDSRGTLPCPVQEANITR